MKNYLALICVLAATFGGCSNLAVYEPNKIESRLSYHDKLPSPIARKSQDGVTLENGAVLSAKRGAPKLQEGFYLLSIDDQFALATDGVKKTLLYENGKIKNEFEDDAAVVAGATDGVVLAIVTKKNSLKVIDAATKNILFFSQERPALTAASPFAKPLIGENWIAFGSLDGKLVVVDRASWQTMNEIVVADAEFFANIAFLVNHEGYVIAAGGGKILSIAPSGLVTARDIDVRQAAKFPSGLFVFARDGAVYKLTPALETLAETKLTYARYAAAAERNGEIWALEQSGYAARFSGDLKVVKIYDLPDSVREQVHSDSRGFWQYEKRILWED
jgi:hypothetical protein